MQDLVGKSLRSRQGVNLLSLLADGSVLVNFLDSGIDFSGNSFGYYFDSIVGHPGWAGGIWYSDTSLNIDSRDHMATYQGKGIDTVQILHLNRYFPIT